MRLLVTVVTPTLNAERYLAETLASVAQQRRQMEVQHIVVDDGSTDRTLSMATASGATVVPGRGRGLYDAMNLGYELADGELVGVLNGDDRLLPGALARLAGAAVASGKSWVTGGLRWEDERGRSLGVLAPPPTRLPVACLASLGWSAMHHQSTYLTRELWSDLGGFDISFRSSADYDLMVRALQRERPARVPGAVATFRRHGANLSSTEPRADAENRRIAEAYGPAPGWRLAAARTATKFWVNARNPGWSGRKLARGGFS